MDKSTLTTASLHEGLENQEPAAIGTEGLVELGTVSDTKGGLVGWFQDIGNGYQFGF